MSRFYIIGVVSVALVCHSVLAQQPSFSPAAEKPKSTSTAMQMSLIWTIVPAAAGGGLVLVGAAGQTADAGWILGGIAIGTAGLLFGPGAGHAYAERHHPMSGAWIRGLGIVVGGLYVSGAAFASSFGHEVSTQGLVIACSISGAVILTSAIYDIATVGRSVDNYNQSRGLASLSIRPAYFAKDKALGISLSLPL